jgi:hypothetical protein
MDRAFLQHRQGHNSKHPDFRGFPQLLQYLIEELFNLHVKVRRTTPLLRLLVCYCSPIKSSPLIVDLTIRWEGLNAKESSGRA